MENQSVYTHWNGVDIGAFQEDAMSDCEAALASNDPLLASQIDAMIADIVESMFRLSEDELHRREVGIRLV